MGLLKTLKPSWWFAAHLHVKFEAVVKHGTQGQQEESVEKVDNPDEIAIEFDEEDKPEQCAANPDEIVLDDDVEPVIATGTAPVPQQTYSETQFLALDKCLPKRAFLEVRSLPIQARIDDRRMTQVIDILAPHDSPLSTNSDGLPCKLTYDPEWLAITRAFDQYFSRSRVQVSFPVEETARQQVREEMAWVKKHLMQGGIENIGGEAGEKGEQFDGPDILVGLAIIEHQTFVQTAPGPGQDNGGGSVPREKQREPFWNTFLIMFLRMSVLLLFDPDLFTSCTSATLHESTNSRVLRDARN